MPVLVDVTTEEMINPQQPMVATGTIQRLGDDRWLVMGHGPRAHGTALDALTALVASVARDLRYPVRLRVTWLGIPEGTRLPAINPVG